MFAEEETIRMSVLVNTALSRRSLTNNISEQICETFPRFRRPELYEFMLLHQCSVDDTCVAMLLYWIKTKDGGRARVELMKVFQSPLAPKELALTLSVMAFLWCLSPLECEEDEFQSPPANLLSLAQLLSRPDTIGENEDLLLELHRSFRCAARSLDEEHFTSIIQLLASSFKVDGESSRSEELHMYFIKRLDGKGHGDAVKETLTSLSSSRLCSHRPQSERESPHDFERVL